MYIADLHIHSKYSRATSKSGDIPNLDLWARRKGIALVGTGDFTHPAWREEMAEALEPAEEGLYRIKPEKRMRDFCEFSVSPRFIVSGEISCIYKQDGKVRKVHNVILLPSLDAAERLSLKLEEIGNIRSDGRPILGLSSKDLLAITLDVCPQAVFIPAHIWTPHFSLFGAFSGFDALEECFGDLSPCIHALETGLSSDPLMNRRVPMLDGYVMVSNSDAHSPNKLGRECNLIDAELSYPALKRALDTGDGFAGTVEFFPEEGKYHLDGHRNCGLRLTPRETREAGGRCPVCGKKITIGVLNRLEQLAMRGENYVPEGAKPFEHLMPLPEVIAASYGISAGGEKAESTYLKMLARLGSEAEILRKRSFGEIERAADERIAEGVKRLREGRVIKTAGYDGEYGKIALFSADELRNASGQLSFFDALPLAVTQAEAPKRAKREEKAAEDGAKRPEAAAPRGANAEQEEAACSRARITAVIAGPGTGKTFTLTERICRLAEQGVPPDEITAVTFTVRAAAEMRARLSAKLKKAAEKITVGTFHSVCYARLKDKFALADRAFCLKTARNVIAEYGLNLAPNKFLSEVSAFKNGGKTDAEDAVSEYCRRLRKAGMLDFDDLIFEALSEPFTGKNFNYLHVDEFQDINPAQYELIKKWIGDTGTLFAIGDPDQAIYSFRGAAANCFSKLTGDYPETKIIRLKDNYRSTPQILDCALRVIANNAGDRALTAVKGAGAKVRLAECASELSEGIFVAKEIARMTGGMDMLGRGREEGLRSFGEIAVLARTHRQLSVIERCLRHDDIPCASSGKSDFLEDPAVCGTLAFFGALCSLNDAERLQAVEFTGGESNFSRLKQKFAPLAGGRPRKVLAAFREQTHISSAAYNKLIDAAHFADMREFLDAMRLGREGDVLLENGKTGAGAVRLTTLHGSKGLEFPAVFLCGLCEKILPLQSFGGETDEEEERRLFYVGMTRAEEELILTVRGAPSPFLSELPSDVKRERAAERAFVQQLSMF